MKYIIKKPSIFDKICIGISIFIWLYVLLVWVFKYHTIGIFLAMVFSFAVVYGNIVFISCFIVFICNFIYNLIIKNSNWIVASGTVLSFILYYFFGIPTIIKSIPVV